MIIKSLILFILILTAQVEATDYYIRKTGCAGCSDSNSCAQAQNAATGFVTINKVATCTFTAGQEHNILIGEGTYPEQIRFHSAVTCNNGTCNIFPQGTSDSARIKILAQSGQTPIIKPATGGGSFGIINTGTGSSGTVIRYVDIGAVGQGLTIDAADCSGSPATDKTCIGIYLQASQFINIRGNTIQNAHAVSGGGCIYTTGASSDNTIESNSFFNCGRDRANHGVYITSANNEINDNIFFNTGGAALHIYQSSQAAGSCHDNTIRRNRMRQNGIGVSNPTAHVVLACPNTSFYANEVVDSQSTSSIGAVNICCPKPGAPNSDIKIYNNTILNATGRGIQIPSTATNVDVQNNIIRGTTGISDSGTNTTLSKNFGCSNCDVGVNTDPLFVNPTGNLTLQATSTAIGAGNNLTADVPEDKNSVTYVVPMTIGAHNSVTSLPPNHLVFSTPPSSGILVATNFTVIAEVRDALDALVDVDTGDCTLSKQAGSGTLAGCTLTVTPVDGICTWTDCTLDAAGDDYILRAERPSTTLIDSSPFEVFEQASPPSSSVTHYIGVQP